MKTTTKTLSRMLCACMALCAMAPCLTACHDDDDDNDGSTVGKRNVTFFNSINGAGDNGYNDNIMMVEMMFSMLNPDVKASFITPIDKGSSIEQFYKMHTKMPTEGDSVLIVLNGSDYTELSRSNTSLSPKNTITGGEALDLRVLTFEDDGHDLPPCVYSFQIHAGRRGNAASFGASIAQPAYGIICRELIELFYRLDFSYFRK